MRKLILGLLIAASLPNGAFAQTQCFQIPNGTVYCPPPTGHDGSAEGVKAGSMLGDNARKTTAYNALRRQYGDVAGDPDAALKMQQYRENEEKRRQDHPPQLPGATCATASGAPVVCP
jgi:hypothetical protein